MHEKSIKETGKFLLSELGIVGESGAHDLMAVLHYLFEDEQAERNIPSLKQMFTNAAIRKLGLRRHKPRLTEKSKPRNSGSEGPSFIR